MLAVVLVLVVAAVAVSVAALVRARTTPEPERGPTWHVPTLVDRRDFDRPDASWAVLAFTSSTCLACADVWEKCEPLTSDAVAVQRVDSIERKDLHDRYGVDAVPMVLLVDEVGSVRKDFIGPTTATDLWSALAELREPGSVPPSCDGDICG